MPEEAEMFEENPVNDSFNDMNIRLADGVTINNQDAGSHREDNDGAGRCVHDWHRVYSHGLDICGLCG
jgi:hypothetical protein